MNVTKYYSTFAIYTLGCKVNTYESQSIINQLTSNGLTQVDFSQKADIYIINTCSVTNTADSKSRNIISRARTNAPNSLIIVAGCYSQVSHNEIKQKLAIDIIIGNKYKNDIISLISQYIKEKKQIVKVDNLIIEKNFEQLADSSFENMTRAFLKIQDGCNFMCSYCIIPFSRGRQRSKSMLIIIEEIKQFVKDGFKEIVLSGVNTAGYLDNDNNSFYDLLFNISKLEEKFRVRISSLEPFQINDEIIELVTSNKERFCSHWHICLQSGSDKVLKDMNRKYTMSEFENLVKKIRIKDPMASISTDYICGYPTETDKDHLLSIENIKKLNFSFLHVFTYSKRKNTSSSNLTDINGDIKKQRTNEIIKLSNDLFTKYIKGFKNEIVEVIFEKEENGIYIGKSSQYFEVMLKSENKLLKLNNFYKLKINSSVGKVAISTQI